VSTVTAAIVGSGNIGTDLLAKLRRARGIDVRYMVGVVPDSPGLARARADGVEASAEGVDWLLARPEPPELVFEATSAAAHRAHAPRYREAGIQAIDLTPAAIGPFVVPVVNLGEHLDAPNINLISCGGQATVPIVAAVGGVTPVRYAETISTVASRSAGQGTRANIDEFTRTTALSQRLVGGAERSKSIIVLNPADPPIIMRNTVYCAIDAAADRERVAGAITDAAAAVSAYVPGFRLVAAPQFDDAREEWGGLARVAVLVEVSGSGDHLPAYAGNLDIITAAAARIGELLAARTGVPE
jgi:acetaldehyde dehydrogenase